MRSLDLRILKWIADHGIWNRTGKIHAAIYRTTGGLLGHSSGKITNLLLTTTGRKSGEPRTVPLSYIAHGDSYVIVASNGGADRDPAWFLNRRAQPEATVQVRSQKIPVQAREADDGERDTLWPLLMEANAFYSRHRQNTDRRIPIVILDPVS